MSNTQNEIEAVCNADLKKCQKLAISFFVEIDFETTLNAAQFT